MLAAGCRCSPSVGIIYDTTTVSNASEANVRLLLRGQRERRIVALAAKYSSTTSFFIRDPSELLLGDSLSFTAHPSFAINGNILYVIHGDLLVC